MPELSPFLRLIRSAAQNADWAPSASPSARSTRPRFCGTAVFSNPIRRPARAEASR
jgi:hypothetical protein